MAYGSPPSCLYSLKKSIRDYLSDTSYSAVKEALDRFVRQSALRLKAGHWLHEQQPHASYLEGNSDNFKIHGTMPKNPMMMPFVEKHAVSPSSKIIVIGDLHGDLETLIAILEQLKNQGYLDSEYKIIKEDTYLLFTGDYTNRMPYSVEVMLLLFHLHNQNIGSIFLLRGNHEIAVCNKHFYDKYDSMVNNVHSPEGIETLLGEFARKFDVYLFPDLLYWYDYLPLANYLGCHDERTGKFNAIQFCHAGIELGYNPQQLLMDKQSRFQRIVRLNRSGTLQKMLTNKGLKPLQDRMHFIVNYLERTNLFPMLETYMKRQAVEVAEINNMRELNLGFQWNDFLTETNDDIGISVSVHRRNFQFGSMLTRYFLEKSGSPQSALVSIVRGHQHLNDYDADLGLNCNMLDVIISSNGCVRQWDGMLYTLGDSGIVTQYQAYLVISLHEQVEKWGVEHFFKRRTDRQFSKEAAAFVEKFER